MSNKIQILVVDDNPINRQYFSMSLSKSGYHVVLAEDGFEAVQQAKNNDFDIILIDIRMPNMDGYEATGLIRAIVRHNNTPIIATSAENLRKSKSSLFDDFLLKPISPKLLKATVQTYCDVNDKDVFNKNNALEFAYQDENIMDKVISMFINELPHNISDLDKAINSNDTTQSVDLIHKIRGSCKACGADELDNNLQQLSEVIKLNNNTNLDDISVKHKQVQGSVEAYIKIVGKLKKQ